jgi:DNA-binding Lrp family transcriptional regulator
MDEKNLKILKTIAEEGIRSPDRIHEITGIPKSTVHYRIDQMQKDGILENELCDMNLEKIGLSITIISEVWAEFEEGYHNIVGEKLGSIEGVNQVYFTMGDTDFITIAHVTNHNMVEAIVEEYESIDEIRRTSSKFVIKTLKDETHPINDFEYETLVDALIGTEQDDR